MSRQVHMSRTQLNVTTDLVLRGRVIALMYAQDGGQVDPPQMLAPFVTNDILHRVHEAIVCVSRQHPMPCSKQKALGMVIANLTGRPKMNPSEAEYCGNLMDRHVKEYVQKLNKISRVQRRRERRHVVQFEAASRAGKRPRTTQKHDDQVSEFRKQLYVCSYGATPPAPALTASDGEEDDNQIENGHHLRRRDSGWAITGPLAVPFRPALDLRDEVRQLKMERILHNQAPDAMDRLRKDLITAHTNEASARSRQALAELKASQAQAASQEAWECARLAEKAITKKIMEHETSAEKAKIASEVALSKAAKREIEAAAAMKKAEKCITSAESRAATLSKELLLTVQIAQSELASAEDAHMSAEDARLKLREALATAEKDRCQALEIAQGTKAKLKAIDMECMQAKGKVHRLQSQLVQAHVDVARASEIAQKESSMVKALKEQLVVQHSQAQMELAHVRQLKARMAQRARDADKRAGSVDELSLQLDSARKKLKETRRELSSTRAQLSLNALSASKSDSNNSTTDAGSDVDFANERERVEAQEALSRIRSMPQWRAVRGSGAGKGAAKLEWGTRVIVYALLSMMVPASAIGTAIVAIVKRTAPWLKPTAPTCETVQRCRFELRLVEEALAGRRIADAYRIRSIGFDETTKFGQASLTSNMQIEPTPGAKLQDVILRAAYCPLGATSELVVKSIDIKCLCRLRDFLRRWKSQFEAMFPGQPWTGPDPSRCSLHRLGGGGAIISDTCNSARKSRALLAELVAEQVEVDLGGDRWASMSHEEREHAVRTHHVDCWQHLRNIFLAEMSSAQAAHVQAELKAELDTFAAWERMTTDFSQLIRAAFKEFHHSCRYYKGQGRAFNVWLRESHPVAFAIHLERAEGGRQGLDYDGAVPLFVDRKFFVEYLYERVFLKASKNILEDFLYVTFCSTQYVAMTRANAIVDVLISRPMRWLSGKSPQLDGWSPRSMGEVLDIVEQFFMKAQHDGSLFLDPTLDLFKCIADKQPLFEQWRKFTFETESVLSPDGSCKHLVWKLARDELLNPTDPTNVRTRSKTIEYLEVQTAAALRKMHDPRLALRDKLTSKQGANAKDDSSQAHMETIGCHSTNDALAESVFGTFDMILRRCPGISQEAASGVSQAIRSMMLSFGDHVAHRKGSRAAKEAQMQYQDYIGYFYTLPEREQESLVELARKTVKEMREIDRADHATLDEYHKMRRKKNVDDELDALFTRYAMALSFFERWCKRGLEAVSEVTRALSGYESVQDQLDFLREQIEMRVIGLSWNEWRTPWSSSKDESVGTVEQLLEHTKEVFKREKELGEHGELPDKERALEGKDELAEQCPAPLLQRKTFKALGTPTVQADALSDSRTELTPDEIIAMAQRRRKELELAGEIDWVCDRQPYNTGQGPVPDKSLVGKSLEIRWRYTNRDTGMPVLIWCEGEVVQAADGESDKRTPRCTKLLPAGALRIKWPADVSFDEEESYGWIVLKPSAFNRETHLGWRFAASELQRMEASSVTQSGSQHGSRHRKASKRGKKGESQTAR